jgi:mono/diheme cytochrome c family protein
MTMLRHLLPGIVSAVAAIAGVAAVAQAVALPDATGRQQVMDNCTRCHGVDLIIAQPRTSEQWSEVVSAMIGHGAEMSDEDYNRIIAYLAENVGPDSAKRPDTPKPGG